MNEITHHENLSIVPVQALQPPARADASDSPFKLTVDPQMRGNLRDALLELIECHDIELARYVSERKLLLESYKEYIELFARSLRECMESREGVAYLLKSCGFEVPAEEINLKPDWRWKNENLSQN